MTESSRQAQSPRAVVLAATVAAVLAVGEATVLIASAQSTPPRTIAALVLMGAMLYAGAALLVATACRAGARALRRRPAASPAALAVAGTLAVEIAAIVVSGIDRPFLGVPLILGGLIGGAAGMLLRRVITPIAWMLRLDFWLGLLAGALTLALALFTVRGLIAPYPLAVGAAILIVLGCAAGNRWIGAPRHRTLLHAGAAAVVIGIFVAVARTPLPPPPGATSEADPSVLLVTIDTLRPDHLGAYGYPTARSPHIDRLAAEGARFANALTTMPQTGPAHASILSGLYPWHHGAEQNGVPMRPTVATVADVLAARGYATAGVVSGWTVSQASSGLASHFATYDESFTRYWWFPAALARLRLHSVLVRLSGREGLLYPPHERPAGITAQAAIDWLEHHPGGPFFLWVHFFDPHQPYAPPREFAAAHGASGNGHAPIWDREPPPAREEVLQDPAAVRDIIARYDGEITYTDLQFGRVRSAAERIAAGRPLLTVLTADHGESLTEHNYFFDHMDLYDVTLRVPLVVHYPGRIPAATVVDSQTRTVDIVPTILELLGLPPLPARDGASLVGLLDGQPDAQSRPALAHNRRGPTNGGSLWMAQHNGYKLIANGSWWLDTLRVAPSEELYDLRADPAELHRLPSDGAVANQLRELLPTTPAGRTEQAPTIAGDVQERLRALGYNP